MTIAQLLKVVAQRKVRVKEAMTNEYRKVQHEPLFQGIERSYQPIDDEGERLPSESKRVQATVYDSVEATKAFLASLWDSVITLDNSNGMASADIVVGGVTVAAEVPAVSLIYLEKQLVDLRTYVAAMPILDQNHDWVASTVAGQYRTEAIETTRTKKVPRNHVLAEATEHHPAQVSIINEDLVVGYWKTIITSGAIPEVNRRLYLDRIDDLLEAVKSAREKANQAMTSSLSVGADILHHIFN